jgi:cytoskeleton protein RodZ
MARKPKQTQSSNNENVEISSASQSSQELTSDAEASLASYEAEYRSRCGGALRASREKLGLTTQEIASRLRLSNKQIEALEADNFAALPEATIVKGFIRNYAKILKVSAEPLLDAYNVIVPDKTPQSFTLQPSANMKVTEYEKPNAMRYVLLGLLLLLGFGAWLFYQNYVQKPSPVTPSAELVSKAEEPLPEVALPAAERTNDETVAQLELPAAGASTAETPTTVAPENAPADPVATTPQAIETVNSPIAPQPPVATAAPSASAASQAVPIEKELSHAAPSQAVSSNKSKLEFNATQETWVSVVDATGKEIYNRILFAGNREIIEASPPLNVTIGNALGTTLDVNGRAVELAPHTRTNVAHVKVD